MANHYDAEKLEAQKRFDALPENLKKELLADKNVQLISNTCKDYGIPEEKVKDVALLVGEVFLGYMKPEEIASELHEFFQIDLQKANFIEIELKQKLFNALKTDLEKVYNPPKIAEEIEEEVAPAIMKMESFDQAQVKKEAVPLAAMPSQPAPIIQKNYEQKIPPMGMGTAALQTQPAKAEQIAPITAEMPFDQAQDKPFIIQTRVEAVKPIVPQFPKETPSLNLQVEASLVQKAPAIKPISVRLETEQPDNIKFKMPVFPQPATLRQSSEQANGKQQVPQMPIALKPIAPQPEKPMSALKPTVEQPRTVHYSNFKTPLTPMGVPKKPEPKKEDYINLTTFTKVSGNTVDLRSTKNEN